MKFSRIYLFGIVVAGFSLAACQPAEQPVEPAAQPDQQPQQHVVEVTALDYAFQAPGSIPSGWSTFEMTNAGQQEHFLVLWRLPEGRSFDDWTNQVVRPFFEQSERYEDGELDREGFMAALGETMPEWFFEARPAGGPGVISPGGIARTSVNLEPGDYVMECYVRTPDGQFHGKLGMMQPLTVTAEDSGAPQPEADINMAISNYELAVNGEFRRGPQTVRVDVLENPDGMLLHNIHLAQLDHGGSAEQAIEWMDWVDSMRAPAPVQFLGGAEDMPAGSTAFVTVDLEPGEYAWISESYSERGVVKSFRVE